MTKVVRVAVEDDQDDGRELLWNKIKGQLRAEYGEDIYSSWFKAIDYGYSSSSVVTLTTATQFIRHWVKDKYGPHLLKLWKAHDDQVAEVLFSVRGSLRARPEKVGASAPHKAGRASAANVAPLRQNDAPAAPVNTAGGLEGSKLEPRFNLGSFVEGPSNSLALAVARKIAAPSSDGQMRYNPFYVCASVGLGKTHLLQGIAQEVAAANPNRRVLYITAETYMYGFCSAIRNRNTVSFKDVLRDVDILLIDDLQFLNGVKVQEEFGHTLAAMNDSGRQVVIAADRPPADLESLDARIRSRLGAGLVVEIEAPDYATRRKILDERIAAQKALFPQLDFPEEIAEFVARRVTTNGRDLDGAVNRLVAHNQLSGQAITMQMAENALRDLLRARESRRPKIDDIQRVVSQHYGVSRQDLVSSRRTRTIVRPRQIAMYLCKMLTPRSLPEIGRRFGNRDHTTVLHAVRKIEELMQTQAQIAEDIETLKRLLDQ